MSKTNFENLRVYLLSEKLSDFIWDIVRKWDSFAKSSVVCSLSDLRIVSELILLRIQVEAALLTIKDLLRLQEHHYTKQNTGFAEHIKEI